MINTRLVDVVCSKLRQMLANMANLLFVVSDPAVDEQLDLPAHIAWIKDRAERSDPPFYERHGFLSTADFFKYYERLSGLILYSPASAHQAALWLNPQARVKLSDPVKNTLQRHLLIK